MRSAEDRVIEGVTYRVMPLAATVGQKVMLRLTKVAAPAMLQLLFSPESAEKGKTGALLAALPGLVRLIELLTEEDLDVICRAFAAETQFGDNSKMRPLAPSYDEHFRGNYVAMFGWLKFSLEVNFAPLWPWAQGFAPLAPAPNAGV